LVAHQIRFFIFIWIQDSNQSKRCKWWGRFQHCESEIWGGCFAVAKHRKFEVSEVEASDWEEVDERSGGYKNKILEVCESARWIVFEVFQRKGGEERKTEKTGDWVEKFIELKKTSLVKSSHRHRFFQCSHKKDWLIK